MRVLVTGAGGFLGGAICRRLAQRGDLEVIATARRASSPPAPRLLDLQDQSAIVQTLAALRPDIVIHAAGRPRGSAGDFEADNVVATANLAEAIGEAAPDAGLILLSSAAQYGRSPHRTRWRETDPGTPIDAYGASKLAAERAAFDSAARRGARVAALRLFNVISPDTAGDTAFSSFVAKAIHAVQNRPAGAVEMAPLGAIRDFVALDDFLHVVELAIGRGVW
ncbi:MAG TPA: NAD-dependent epimerase/dehydratase family protein, partial [Caulobacteraceae bacterium]|nr:NAD-dependent epimerase/dehydratase family protein [Caulobacteraceae bacterium]